MNPSRLFWSVLIALSSLCGSAQATECRVEGVVTYTGNVNDVYATPDALWVASEGGVEEFDRKTRQLIRTYTHLDGLSSSSVSRLFRDGNGSLAARTSDATCHLRGTRFECKNGSKSAAQKRLRFAYKDGVRVTAEKHLPEGDFFGTAGAHAYVGKTRLGAARLPDRHITSLALLHGRLFVGTFNGGLAAEDEHGTLRPIVSPGRLVNALQTGREHLFVGTSQGLFKTKDGLSFEKVDLVEQAVVGLSFDGTSIWATTPGALYRIRDGKGPRSDVWWLPGGSRSLQKVSAVPGYVWFGTEDRGAISMKTGPKVMSQDKPFSVYDRSQGLPSSWSLAVAARPDGSAWMTTLREGVSFIPVRGESQRVRTGVSDWGLSALAVPGGVWIGSQDGATFVSDDGATSTPVRDLPDARVHAFLVDTRKSQTRLWIGTENGLGWCTL